MGYISYFAVDQGNMVAGHSEGTEYTIEIDFERYDPSTKRNVNERKALSGKKFTRFHSKERHGSFTTIWQDDTDIHAQMKEFADSVDAGEEFVIDPYGTLASPIEPMTVTLKGEVTQTRYKKMERWKYTINTEQ